MRWTPSVSAAGSATGGNPKSFWSPLGFEEVGILKTSLFNVFYMFLQQIVFFEMVLVGLNMF